MITQKQVDALVKIKFDEMEKSMNKVEEELLLDDDFNKAKAAFYFSKVQDAYLFIAKFLGIYDKDLVDKK